MFQLTFEGCAAQRGPPASCPCDLPKTRRVLLNEAVGAEQLAALWSHGDFQMTALMDDPVMQSSPSPPPRSADGPHFPSRHPRLRAS